MSYSAETERYIASVVAVGGEWPSRVDNLRRTYPNNEAAFKSSLERYVYAAHGQQAPDTIATPTSAAATPSSAYPGQKSYPGQLQGPTAPSTPATAAAGVASGTPASNSSLGYIPYAREKDKQTNAPLIRPRPSNISTSNPTLATTSSLTRRDSAQPRMPSSLNPAASRPNKVPRAHPLSTSTQPFPPYFPVSAGQAYMTTYPSRLRLGLTTLMQPLTSSGNVVSANTNANALAPREKDDKGTYVPTSAKATDAAPTVLGKRQRSRVDYRERVDIPEAPSSSSDEDENPDGMHEEEDGKQGRGARTAKGTASSAVAQSARENTPASELARANGKEDANAGHSWLGKDPPSHIVLVQAVRRYQLPYIPEDEMALRAQDRPLFVPIRIEFDIDGYRIRDYFTWNLSESTISPEMFSKVFCLDASIPYEPYGTQIATNIKNQLDEWMGTAEVSLLTPEQEDLEMEADLRVIINIDVQLGTMHLIDRVEWDLTSSLTPEAFAAQMCTDLGLGGESIMLIAHSIHEELLRLKKDCLESGVVGNLSGSTAPVRGQAGPKRLESVWRDWNEAKSFGPHVEILSPEEIEALEMDKDRNPRRSKHSESKYAIVQPRERVGRRR